MVQARQLSALRNEVAHGFHKREYKPKLTLFVEAVLEKPLHGSDLEMRGSFIGAIEVLA